MRLALGFDILIVLLRQECGERTARKPVAGWVPRWWSPGDHDVKVARTDTSTQCKMDWFAFHWYWWATAPYYYASAWCWWWLFRARKDVWRLLYGGLERHWSFRHDFVAWWQYCRDGSFYPRAYADFSLRRDRAFYHARLRPWSACDRFACGGVLKIHRDWRYRFCWTWTWIFYFWSGQV